MFVNFSNRHIKSWRTIENKQLSDVCIDDGDVDDSIEPVIVNADDAANGLEIVRSFLQQDSNETNDDSRWIF